MSRTFFLAYHASICSAVISAAAGCPKRMWRCTLSRGIPRARTTITSIFYGLRYLRHLRQEGLDHCFQHSPLICFRRLVALGFLHICRNIQQSSTLALGAREELELAMCFTICLEITGCTWHPRYALIQLAQIKLLFFLTLR